MKEILNVKINVTLTNENKHRRSLMFVLLETSSTPSCTSIVLRFFLLLSLMAWTFQRSRKCNEHHYYSLFCYRTPRPTFRMQFVHSVLARIHNMPQDRTMDTQMSSMLRFSYCIYVIWDQFLHIGCFCVARPLKEKKKVEERKKKAVKSLLDLLFPNTKLSGLCSLIPPLYARSSTQQHASRVYPM